MDHQEINGILQRAEQSASSGRFAESQALYRRILDASPRHPAALNGLAIAVHLSGNWEMAIALAQQAIEAAPGNWLSHNTLGELLRRRGRFEDAIAAFNAAISLQPAHPAPSFNCGLVFHALRRFDEAEQAYMRALRIQPNNHQALTALGAVRHLQGRFDECLALCQRALEILPTYAEAHYNRSLVLLLRGELEKGFIEYEWRHGCAEVQGAFHRVPGLRFTGADPKGKTIFLHTEQGLGDAIQFVRYASVIAERGAQIVIGCAPELKRVFTTVPGVRQVIVPGDALPGYHFHESLMSLPLKLGTMQNSIPANIPYLSSDPVLRATWAERIAQCGRGMKIGLSWSGKTYPNPLRAIDLDVLAPLANRPDITFFSLQKGDAARAARHPPGGMRLIDFSDDLHDFADTAALISQLDLVVTIDTAVAHLSGALGQKTWTLLPAVPSWRWLLEKETTPWYPTMRLFRQTSVGDWQGVVARLATELRKA